MYVNYRGIYFQNRNHKEHQKKFYEHGAHFEYKALYKILEEITKKIKPKINSSLPKKKNPSLNKKRTTSCKRKKNLCIITKKNNEENQNNKIYNIKVNLSQFSQINDSNKKINVNNSLIIKNKDMHFKKLSSEKMIKKRVKKNFSSEKYFKNIDNNYSFNNSNKSSKNISLNNTTKNKISKNFNIIKKQFKHTTNMFNNSIEYYNKTKLILGDSINNNTIKKINRIKYLNPMTLNNNSKNNKKINKIIFSYNNNKKVNILGKKYGNKIILNKINKKQKFLQENNNNDSLIINNKNEIIIDDESNSFFNKDNNLIIKSKINIPNIKINHLKTNKNSNKTKNNFNYENNSFQIKTPKYNFIKNTNNKAKNKTKLINLLLASSGNNSKNNTTTCKKSSKQIVKEKVSKFSINDMKIVNKQSRQLKNEQVKLSRNNDDINQENSFFKYYNSREKVETPFRNILSNSLVIKEKENTVEKIKNIELSDLIDEKEKENESEKIKKKYLFVNRRSVEKKHMKRYIKNKLLKLNKLIKNDENESCCKLSETIKNDKKHNLNQNRKLSDNISINFEHNKNPEKKIKFLGKSYNDSINKSKTNKNGDKKSIISTNLTSHINSNGIIIPLNQKKMI